jgi:hypothetical protein
VSFDYTSIASKAAMAPWFSPQAADMHAPHTDLAALHDAKKEANFNIVRNLWLNEICSHKNHLALGFRNAAGSLDWYVCMHGCPKSATMFWPARLQTVAGTNFQYLEPSMESTGIHLKGLFNLKGDDVRAASYEWKSCMWQSHHLPRGAVKSLPCAIRAFVDKHGVDSVQNIACYAAWWDISRVSLGDFAQYFDVAFEAGISLVDLLWCMIHTILKCDDQTALDILNRRVCRGADFSRQSQSLLEVDEAWEVIDPLDTRKVDEAQKEARSAIANHRALRDDFVAKAVAVKAKEDGKNKKKKQVVVVKIKLPHHISQPEAKRYVPPGASVWRSLVRSEWCGHLPPAKRCTEPFSRHEGSEGALKALLRRLWAQHLDRTGAPHTACPIDGLFDA